MASAHVSGSRICLTDHHLHRPQFYQKKTLKQHQYNDIWCRLWHETWCSMRYWTTFNIRYGFVYSMRCSILYSMVQRVGYRIRYRILYFVKQNTTLGCCSAAVTMLHKLQALLNTRLSCPRAAANDHCSVSLEELYPFGCT